MRRIRGAVLVLHIGDLLLADAVLAGAGAAHGDGAVGEAGGESFGGVDLVGVAHVDKRAHMKIAVGDMAEDRGDEACRAAGQDSERSRARAGRRQGPPRR
jgi:hypothetical protein